MMLIYIHRQILWWVWPSRLRRQIVVLEIVGSIPTIHPIILRDFNSHREYAGMAELADALDLGSSVNDVGVQVLFPAPCRLPIPSIFSRWRDRIDEFNLTAFRGVRLFFCRKSIVFGQIVE